MSHSITIPHIDQVQYRVHDSIAACRIVWDSLNNDPFMCSDYLLGLQQAVKTKMSFRYLVFHQAEVPVGIAYLQIYPFSVARSFKAFRENIHKPRGWSFKTWFADRVAMHALVCGNLIITGEHGFRFVSSIDSTHRIQIVHAAMKEIFRSLKKDYPDLQLFFIKEQSDIGDQSAGDFLVNQGFYRFHVQPKMIFKVNDSWLRMDDYLDGLKSKYRLRMKRAKARLQPIQAVNLDQDKIEKEHQVIFELFQQVVDEADFHMVDLLPEYFVRLKENMGDAFQMRAYYLEGQMIGFISYLEDNESLYAHFTGFRRNLNESHDLYLNILLDLIETSIEKKLTILDLSRTALEIKSSVGAVPHRMLGYLKHDRPFYNFLLSRIFTFFYPGKAWNQRNPFKAIS